MGTGAATSNAGPAAEYTVEAIQNNSGLLGDVARVVGGGSGHARRAYAHDSLEAVEGEKKGSTGEKLVGVVAEKGGSADRERELSKVNEQGTSTTATYEDNKPEHRSSFPKDLPVMGGVPVVGKILGTGF